MQVMQGTERHGDIVGVLPKVGAMIQNFLKSHPLFRCDPDELVGEAHEALCEAALKCDDRPFEPFALRSVGNALRDVARKAARRSKILGRRRDVERLAAADDSCRRGEMVSAFEGEAAEALGVPAERAFEAFLSATREACDAEEREVLDALREGRRCRDLGMSTTRWFRLCRRIGAVAFEVLRGPSRLAA